MIQATVVLRPLTRTDLPAITPWFEDPDTCRYLGGPAWPATMLDLGEQMVGQAFRGAIQTGAHHYLAEVDAVAVGDIDAASSIAAPPTTARDATDRSSPKPSRR
jgi:hypothetical protein